MSRTLSDDRSQNAKDIGIGIQWLGVPCQCRCRHCSLESGARVSKVPFERAKALAERFVPWRQAEGKPGFSVDLVAGYAADFRLVAEGLAFNRQYGTASDCLLMNGTRFKQEGELADLFILLKQAGVASLGITFYGLGDYHDRWAKRKGDFDYNLLVARAAAASGLPRYETVFFSREAIADLPGLIELLEAIPGRASRSLAFWDYRGRGKTLEEERVMAADIARLPEHIKAQISLQSHGGYLSEAAWVQRIDAGDFPRKSRRYYLLSIWEDNICRFESTDCGEIIREIRETDERFHRALPSLETMARLYGEVDNTRLYSLRDLEWKWTDRHLETHPEIDRAGRFSDLNSVILWS